MATSLLNRILRLLGNAALDAAEDELHSRTRKSRQSRTSRQSSAARDSTRSSSNSTADKSTVESSVGVWDTAGWGLPPFSYEPDPDGQADPGEVVWTWVPYEEDASRGKDRPVVVLAKVDGRLVVAQMTSKDHDLDAAQEAHWGRYWHDVGSGAWDSRGRNSEVRLDRLLTVDPLAVRREGATMPRDVFNGVVAALQAHWSKD